MPVSDQEFLDALSNVKHTAILLVCAEYYNTYTNTVETLYVSNGAFITSPTDALLPNVAFNDVLDVDVVKLITNLKIPNPTTNSLNVRITTNTDSLSILNTEGMYDYLTNCIFDGHVVDIYLGIRGYDFPDFRKIKSLIASNVVMKDEYGLTLNFASFDTILDREAQTRVVNVGPSKGKQIPIAYGKILRASPLYLGINPATGKRRYKLNEFPIYAIEEVHDNGVLISAANVVKYLDFGEFELTTEPVGTLTVNLIGTKVGSTALRYTGEILKHLLSQKCSSVVVDEASFTYYDQLVQSQIGIYIAERMNLNELVDTILDSTLGFKYFNAYNEMVIEQFDLLYEVDPVELTNEIIIDGKISQVDAFIMPIASAKVSYAANFTPSEQIAASIPEAQRTVIKNKHSIANSGILHDDLTISAINIVDIGISSRVFFAAPVPALANVSVGDYLVVYLGVIGQNQGYFKILTVDTLSGTLVISNPDAVTEPSISATASILKNSLLYAYYKNPINTNVRETFLVYKDDAIAQCEQMLQHYNTLRRIYSITITNINVNFRILQHVILKHPRFGLQNGVNGWIIKAPDVTYNEEISLEILV